MSDACTCTVKRVPSAARGTGWFVTVTAPTLCSQPRPPFVKIVRGRAEKLSVSAACRRYRGRSCALLCDVYLVLPDSVVPIGEKELVEGACRLGAALQEAAPFGARVLLALADALRAVMAPAILERLLSEGSAYMRSDDFMTELALRLAAEERS